MNSLTGNSNLVTKIYFPREIFPFTAIAVSLVDLAIGSIVLVGLMVYYRIPPTPALIFLPVVVLINLCFTTGIGLLLAMANLFFRDVKYLFELVISMWMFGTAVVYPISLVGGHLAFWLKLNPMTPMVEAYRDVILRGELPQPALFASVSVVAIMTLGLGWLLFHRSEFLFAENL